MCGVVVGVAMPTVDGSSDMVCFNISMERGVMVLG